MGSSIYPLKDGLRHTIILVLPTVEDAHENTVADACHQLAILLT